MTDGDDSSTWLSSALRHVELATHQIARFTNPWWDPTWSNLVSHDHPLPLSVGWATCGRRSRSTRKHSTAAADDCSCSPGTPFDFGSRSGSESGSSFSTSGEEDGFVFSKKRRVGDSGDISGRCKMKMSFPVGPIPVAKYIRARGMGKKKTLCQLQEEERLLLENKNQLQKEIDARMKAYQDLRADILRLKSQQVSFHSERVSVGSATVGPSFETPSSNTRFILPDLDRPLSENLD